MTSWFVGSGAIHCANGALGPAPCSGRARSKEPLPQPFLPASRLRRTCSRRVPEGEGVLNRAPTTPSSPECRFQVVFTLARIHPAAVGLDQVDQFVHAALLRHARLNHLAAAIEGDH